MQLFSFNISHMPFMGLLVFIIVELVWLWSVLTVARQKTPDPFDRIVWLMIVLALNIIGTILYALFSPRNVIDPQPYRSPFHSPSARQARRNRPQPHAGTAEGKQTPP